MGSLNKDLTSFSDADMVAFQPTIKIGLIATINEQGLPHLSLISSLQANGPTQLIWGQFTEGLCKRFVRQNPKTGFLIMTLAREFWCGRADFTHTASQGPEFDMYNNTPMFRYNAYFGVHTVYFMDLVSQTGRQRLPMAKIVRAALQTAIGRLGTHKLAARPVLNLWTRQLLNKIDNLKFLAYVGADGYPVIVPVIQAQAAGRQHVIFALAAFRPELLQIPTGASLALLGMTLEMEDVLLRGRFEGIRRVGGVNCGVLEVDWVYNPMPPKPQQIYPEVSVKPVRVF